MKVLTRSEIQKLASTKQNPSISIIMPTATSDFAVLRSRFRKLLLEARDKLSIEYNDQSIKHTALYAGYELLHKSEWWRKADKSVAIYLAKDFVRAYHLADDLPTSVVVGSEFDIVPLLESVSDDEFHILALNQNSPRLFWTNRHAIEEIKLDNIPKQVVDSSSDGINLINNKPVEKPDIFHLLRSVDNIVTPYLNKTQKPLILVGLPHIAALYQGISSYQHTVQKYVAKSPDGMTMLGLRDRAWATLKPLARRDQHLAYSQFDRLIRSQPQRTARGFRQVMSAIVEGRVQTLFINTRVQKWGSLNAIKAVDVHDKPHTGDINLLNMLASSALGMGNSVFSLPETSANLETAAILRAK